MMDINFFELFSLHALVSLLPGLLGAIFGVAIGHQLLRLLRPPAGDGVRVSRFALLIPWRGFVLLTLVILLPSPYATILFGLGIPPALMTVFLSTVVLAVGLVLHGGFAPTPDHRKTASVAYIRTALVASVGFAVVTHEYGSDSAGFLITQGMHLFEYGVMWSGYAIVGILAILVDVIGGLGHLLLARGGEVDLAAS